jgi:hypothetical protein
VALDGRSTHLEHRGDLGHGQPHEVAQLDDPTLLRIDRAEPVEALVEGE